MGDARQRDLGCGQRCMVLMDGIDNDGRKIPLPCHQPADLGVIDAEHGAFRDVAGAVLVVPPLRDLGIGRRKGAGQRQPADVVQQAHREGQVAVVAPQLTGQGLRTQGTADRMAPEGVMVEGGLARQAAGHAGGGDDTAHRAQAEYRDRLRDRAHLPAPPVERRIGQAQGPGGQRLVARDLGSELRGAEFVAAQRGDQFEHDRRQRGQVAQRREQLVVGNGMAGRGHFDAS